jgi:hypothetical protein
MCVHCTVLMLRYASDVALQFHPFAATRFHAPRSSLTQLRRSQHKLRHRIVCTIASTKRHQREDYSLAIASPTPTSLHTAQTPPSHPGLAAQGRLDAEKTSWSSEQLDLRLGGAWTLELTKRHDGCRGWLGLRMIGVIIGWEWSGRQRDVPWKMGGLARW